MAETGLTSYRVACLRFSKPEVALDQSLAEACLQWSPQIAIRSGEAIFLEIGRSRNLYTERSLIARLHALASRFGLQAQVAVENSAALSLAMARHAFAGSPLAFDQLPVKALECFVNPFEELGPEESNFVRQLLEALRQLEVRSLGEFCQLPASGFPSRFGKKGAALISKVRAARLVDLCAWPGFHPLEKITEVQDCECENLETLIFVLRGPVDRAMARIRGRNERAAVVELELEFENWSTLKETRRQWRIELPVPQGSASGLIPIIRERLGSSFGKTALPAPSRKLAFTVHETAPGRGAQKNFFNQKEEEAEALDSLIAKLSERLGREKVYVARLEDRYLPEASFSKVIAGEASAVLMKNPPEAATPLCSARPARITSEPELLHKANRLLIHPDGRRWEVSRWIGPERISGEWFDESGFNRDYYRAVCAGGEQLWIYVERGSVYLHGFFD